jgi:hypothetical protein
MGSLAWMQKAVTLDFQLRIHAALNYIATAIVNEPIDTPHHSTRMTAARRMLNGQININDFSKLVATDAELRVVIDAGADPTDFQLLPAVERSLVVLSKASI